MAPGALNLVTGAAYAHLGAMPMILITGQKAIMSARQARFQIVDIVATMKPLTKASRQIVSATSIPTVVRDAFRLASEERPGPVHLELPEDIAGEKLDRDVPLVPVHPIEIPVAHAAALDRAAELLLRAERPLVMFGAACNRPRLAGQLTDFIRRTGIPFFNTQMGKGTVAGIGTTEGGTELWMGTAALTERDYVHEAIDQADLILSIGHDTIEKPPFIMGPKGPKVIHVGYTPANVEQVYFPDAEVVGDLGPSLALLADRVQGKLPNAAALVPLRKSIIERTLARSEESRFPLTPQRIVSDVRKVMPADGIVALDNGMYKIWFARCYRTRNANALLLDNALGDDGRRAALGDDGRDAEPGQARAGGVRRRRVHDELAGARNALADWLLACGVDTVALESTGVYWIPVYEVLEQRGLKVWLVDARQMKYVPGRKSDVQDCQWLQKLMSLGLLRAAWRPDGEVCVVRAVARQREVLLIEQASWVQRMQKALVQMNIQLTEVLADVMGMTGQAIIRAIVAGERDPFVLARHHNRRIKVSKDDITKALTGNWREEHLFVLAQALAIHDDIGRYLAECHAKLQVLLAERSRGGVDLGKTPKAGSKTRAIFDVRKALADSAGVDLTRINGLDVTSVMKILSEIGPDLSRFANVKHFCSWLGLCPATKISGGKLMSASTKRSANRVRQALKMAAMSLSRSRICPRRLLPAAVYAHGQARANTAVAHKLARLVYFMLTRGEAFVDQGSSTTKNCSGNAASRP